MASYCAGMISNCVSTQTDAAWLPELGLDTSESALPREFRNRLHKMFERIEREFEREYHKIWAENYALQEKLEKFEEVEHPEPNIFTKKLIASQLSHRIKQQYKQSTSRFASSRRSTSDGLSFSSGPGQNLDSSRPSSLKFVHEFTGHRDGIWEVTSYRNLVATASADATVRLWANSEQPTCLLVYTGHSGSVNSVRFQDRRNLMLTCSGDGTAHLFRIPLAFFEAGAALSTHGTQPLQGVRGDDTEIGSQWDGAPNTTDPDNQVGENPSHCPAFLRDPLAVFQSASLFPSDMASPVGSSSLDSSPLAAADFLSGRDQLVTASWDRLGRLYDLNTGQEVQSLAGHDHELTDVRCCSVETNLPVAVTSARDSTFRVWDFRQNRLAVYLQQAHSRTVSTAQFLPGPSPDYVVSAGTDRLCRLWDLRNPRSALLSIRTDAGVNRLAIAPTGVLLRKCNGSTTRSSLQPNDNTLPTPPTTTTGLTNSGALEPSLAPMMMPCVFALPLDNKTVRIAASNGARIGHIQRNTTHGHTRAVTSAAWADEGVCNLFTAGFDHQLLGWQVQVS